MGLLRVRLAGAAALTILLAACHGGGGQSVAQSTPSAEASTEVTPSAEPTASSSPGAGTSESATSPTASPTEEPTPPPNLLAFENGTIVRSFTPEMLGDPDGFSEDGNVEAKAADGQTAVFEMPGVADLTALKFWMDGREPDKAYSVTVAGSTTGPDSGFTDITTANSTSGSQKLEVPVHATARWLKVTLHGNQPHIGGLYAFGALRPRPANAPSPAPVMVYTRGDLQYQNGRYNVGDEGQDPWYVRVTTVGDSMTVTECNQENYSDVMIGKFDGRRLDMGEKDRYLVLNDEGTQLVGRDGGPRHYAVPKSGTQPKFCQPIAEGSGSRKILVLDKPGPANQFGLEKDTFLPNVSLTRIAAPMLTKDLLDAHAAVIFNMICVADEFLTKPQLDMINDYVHSGHVAIIWDSDGCGNKTDYSFLPYQFKTDNPGAAGAHGKRLIETESDALGSFDKSDTAHYFDAQSYADDKSNQLGDANTTVTKDEHWCGHLFGTNTHNVNGFMQMYAPYGQGFFVYDGFDHDDAGEPPHQRVRMLEMMLSVPADLPCTTKVSQGFILQPNRDGTFTAGKSQTLHFDMELLANEGWAGHVQMLTTGDFKAAVSPQQFDISGGTQPVGIDVTIPASAKAGTYAITVQASDGSNTTSQAVISLTATAPLIKQIQQQKRIRLYGIHFDYDSAHIQPRSEPVIKQVADLMKQDPKVRFQVEGHTDSDGGADYNLNLSQRRAQAVVDDLVHRYHIAASRLVAKGFGLTRPVAPNTTEGGKALNRRVELLVL